MNLPLPNLHRLQVFQVVARRLSFTSAAEDLHTSQPNVSKHMRLLEAELGTPLFDRMGKRVALTDAGRIVLDYTERLFETIEQLHRTLNELEGLERGYLRLGASNTPGVYVLPPVLAGFRRSYPNLEISFSLGNSQKIIQEVLRGKIDLGFVEGYVNAPGIYVQPFISDEYVLIASTAHPLLEKESLTPKDLVDETFIWREVGSGTREGMSTLLEKAGIQPKISLELHSCEGVKRAVSAGLGISVVSRLAIELELAQQVLAILHGDIFRSPHNLYIITRKDKQPSVASLAFLAHLRKQAHIP